MGYAFTLECGSCNYGRHFHLRRNLGSQSIEAILGRMHHRRRHRILSAIDGQEINAAEKDHRLFRCPKCNDIREAYYVKVTYNRNQVIETLYRCKVCKQQLISLKGPQDTLDTPCPSCRARSLRIAVVVENDEPP